MAPKTASAALDLASFDLETEADRGGTMELLAPRSDKASGMQAGQPLGITLTVLGEDSPTFRRNLREMIDEVNADLVSQPKEPDTIQKMTLARTAACSVTGWEGVVFNGKKLEFSREAAVTLFFERPWIARQVESFRVRPGNFGPR